MKPRTAVRFAVALAVPCVLCLPVHGQDGSEKPAVRIEGLDAFRQLLEIDKLRTIESIAAFKQLVPEKTMVIILGSTAPGRDIWHRAPGIRDYTLNGGAVLIASYEDHGLLEDLMLEI